MTPPVDRERHLSFIFAFTFSSTTQKNVTCFLESKQKSHSKQTTHKALTKFNRRQGQKKEETAVNTKQLCMPSKQSLCSAVSTGAPDTPR